MKPVHTTLLASAFLAVTYIAVPSTVSAGGRECATQTTSKAAAARRVDLDMDVALFAARKGSVVQTEIDAVGDSIRSEGFAWIDVPDQCQINEMLLEEIADLQARAAAFRAHEADVLKLQFHIAMGRFERAVAEIELAWSKGLLPDDIAQKSVYELQVLAFDYVASLGTTNIRAALQAALDNLLERGTAVEERANALREMYVKIYSLRLEAALAILQERVTKGIATKQDYMRIAKYVAALERLQTFLKPFPCDS